MPGEGIRTPPSDGVGYDKVVISDTSTPIELVGPAEGAGSVVVRSWQSGGNSGTIYVGWDNQVDSSTGFPLEDGDSITLEISTESQSIWIIGDTQNDEVRYLATN